MSNIVQAQNIFTDKYVEGVMDRLKTEIDALQTWFRRDFPESRLEVNIDLNKIKRMLMIQCRVVTGKEVAVNNRGSFLNLVKIEEKNFMDRKFMDEFLLVFNEQYRKEISQAVNNHFHMEKAKSAIEY